MTPRALGILLLVLSSMAVLATPSVPKIRGATSTGDHFDHVVVIMMENEGIRDICGGNASRCNGVNSPYLSSLANTYGTSQQYVSLIQTSEPNYYGFLGASLYACKPSGSGCYPPAGSITSLNLVDLLENAGLSWKGYMENKTAGCGTTTVEPYEHEHSPFAPFQDITNNTGRCGKIVLANPSSCGGVTDCSLINDLNSSSAPNFMWLTPNDCDNMHANSVCTIQNGYNGCTTPGSACILDGDNYLMSLVPHILNSQTFTTTRSALFITFDEGSGSPFCPINGMSEDCLPSIWAGPQAKNNYLSSNLYNHYSITKTIEANWNLPSLTTNDANANAMSEFFKVQPPDFSLTANPTSVLFNSGSTSFFSVNVSPSNGFAGNVTITNATLPSTGLGASCTPNIITGGSGVSSCTLSSSTPGNYSLTVTGTSGVLTHSIVVSVSVRPPADFSISASPSSITLGQPPPSSLTPVPVTTSGDRTWFESSYLSDSFYAEGLTWLFYENYSTNFTCEHHSGCLYYTTSPDGSAWSIPRAVNNNAGRPLHVTDSDFSVYSNMTDVFYVRYNSTSFQSSCNREFYVREGKLSPSGSVAWSQEILVATALPWQTYDDTYITMDSVGQLWLGYMITNKGTCGGSGAEVPVVRHSNSTNYTLPWTGNFNLTTEKNNIWNVALVSLGGGQMYASFWTKHYSLHGRLYDPTANPQWEASEELISGPASLFNSSTGLCSGTGSCLDVNAWSWAAASTVYDLYFDNITKNYYLATRFAGSWNSPGVVAAVGDRYAGYDCCGAGSTYFNTAWYSIPDTASYYNGTFYLYYMQASNSTIDQWSGGPNGTWTKTTGIIQTTSVTYPDSIASFISYSQSSSFTPTGGIYYTSGSTSPFTYNFAILPILPVNSVTITVTSLNGFSGNVNLITSITPSSGLTIACNQYTILAGSGSTICTLSASGPGSYTANFTGSSGSLSHSTMVSVSAPSGTVGGRILSIDKIGILIQLLAPAIPILILLCVVISSFWPKRRTKSSC